ncbi:MAG: hypothetical protein WCP30_18890 [Mycobacteriaceae bacterium]
MTVGEQVQSSLDHWSVGDGRSALWHATAALDETAKKRYPGLDKESRFKRVIRDDVDIFAAMTAPDINLVESRFPVPVPSDLPDRRPDIADVLYGVHRYLHEDESAMLAGCEVTAHADGVPMFEIARGRLWLRGSAALGLLGIAVFAAENKGEQIPPAYNLGWREHVFHISGWWGWQNHFRDIVSHASIPQFTLDFAEEWDTWGPVA